LNWGKSMMYDQGNDPLTAARGVVVGVLFSLALWVLLVIWLGIRI
jgi:hypothetical protein